MKCTPTWLIFFLVASIPATRGRLHGTTDDAGRRPDENSLRRDLESGYCAGSSSRRSCENSSFRTTECDACVDSDDNNNVQQNVNDENFYSDDCLSILLACNFGCGLENGCTCEETRGSCDTQTNKGFHTFA